MPVFDFSAADVEDLTKGEEIVNPYEARARKAKAEAVALFLYDNRITAEEADSLPQGERDYWTEEAGEKRSKSNPFKTWEAVCDKLTELWAKGDTIDE